MKADRWDGTRVARNSATITLPGICIRYVSAIKTNVRSLIASSLTSSSNCVVGKSCPQKLRKQPKTLVAIEISAQEWLIILSNIIRNHIWLHIGVKYKTKRSKDNVNCYEEY